MTKESVIKDIIYDIISDSVDVSFGGVAGINVATRKCTEIAVEYAKQQSIEFDKWKIKNNYHYNGNSDLGYYYQGIFIDNAFSINQLYDLSLESINNPQNK